MSKKKNYVRNSAQVFRPPGLDFPVKMRELFKVVLSCDKPKSVSFVRRQVETEYTNPHIYTVRTYPMNKEKIDDFDRAISGDNIKRLRRALKTLEYKPSIDLENNMETWMAKEDSHEQ